MRYLITFLLCIATFSQQAAIAAQPATEALSTCLADHTSGKDRKNLARWIFLAISVHPEIRSFASATGTDHVDADKTVATLVTRLLVEDCTAQTRTALKEDGQIAMFNAFRSLGEAAMQELMTNKDVAASVNAYTRYLDSKKLDAALTPR